MAGEMVQRDLSGDRRADAGFIIVAVLWLLGALATLAVIYSLYLNQSALAFNDHNERLQAQAMAMAGVEVAVYRMTETPDRRPLSGQFSFRQGSAVIEVAFNSESGRIDLNFAPKEVLAGLFLGLGVPRNSALEFADRIVGWRTPLNGGADDGEAAIYQAAGKSYGPRHGPFQHINELGLLAGLPPWLIDRALPYLTVYSGRAEVNVLNAAPEVLAALPGITPALLQQLLTQRVGAPQDVLRAQLGIAANYVSLRPSAANRVTVEVRFPTGRRIRSEAVVFLLDKDTQPYRVLSWHDEELAADPRSGVLAR